MGRRELAVLVFCCAVATAARAQQPQSGPASHATTVAAGDDGEGHEATAPRGPAAEGQALERIARGLLEQALRSEDSSVRWLAMRAMRTLEDPELAAAVRALADSEDRYVQALALEVLTNADPRGSRDVFLEKLESPFRTIRLRALRGLERLQDPNTVSLLGTVLVTDEDPEIRAFAARILGTMGARQAIAVLKPALDDSNELVREETVAALVKLGDEGIVEVLRERLATAPAMERAGVIRLARLVPSSRLMAALGPLLGDGDPEVRAFAAGAILSIRHQLSEGSDGG